MTARLKVKERQREFMLDFSNTFNKYETLVRSVDQSVNQIKESNPDGVRCAEQCSDCCHAVFDLSLIESVYLNIHFFHSLDNQKQETILERAGKADRIGYKLKRKLHKMVVQEGKKEEEALLHMAKERVRCPFLNEADLCDLYENRPITCRVYGVPTAIHGAGHTCGKSGFKEGTLYPTINLDRINQRLFDLSKELLQEIGSKDQQLQTRLLPVSTTLLTDFDEEFFGLNPACSV
jgi:Fe-S-cluster containining protein